MDWKLFPRKGSTDQMNLVIEYLFEQFLLFSNIVSSLRPFIRSYYVKAKLFFQGISKIKFSLEQLVIERCSCIAFKNTFLEKVKFLGEKWFLK